MTHQASIHLQDDSAGKYAKQFFTTEIPKELGLKSASKFLTTKMHFHTKSQHTIDNKQYDLELVVYHKPLTAGRDVRMSAMSILFDTEDFNERAGENEGLVA